MATTQELNEMAARCGLEEPQAFKMKGIGVASYPRGSGRTTAMLLDALVCVEKGYTVLIYAYTPAYAAQLVRRCRQMAEDAGIPWEKIHSRHNRKGIRPGQEGVVQFHDHYMGPRRQYERPTFGARTPEK